MRFLSFFRFRFSLRAMLVLMTLFALFFWYHIDWIKLRRRELIAFDRYNAQERRLGNTDYPGWHDLYMSMPHYQSKSRKALPLMLWLCGEKPQPCIVKEWHDASTWLEERDRLVSLFPEAMITLQIRGGEP